MLGYNPFDGASMATFKKYIKDFELLEEIPLITAKGYMKADILLVKKSASGTSITDAIIIENKLSEGTAFTERQKEGFGAIINGQTSIKTKYSTSSIGENVSIPISKDKIFKFNDAGTDNISNVTGSKINSVR